MLELDITWDITLVGLGSLLAGVGSFMAGLAALRRANKEPPRPEPEPKPEKPEESEWVAAP